MLLIPAQLQRRNVTSQFDAFAIHAVDTVVELEFGSAVALYITHLRQRIPRHHAGHFERAGGMARPGGNRCRNEDCDSDHDSGEAACQSAQTEPFVPGNCFLRSLSFHVLVLPTQSVAIAFFRPAGPMRLPARNECRVRDAIPESRGILLENGELSRDYNRFHPEADRVLAA